MDRGALKILIVEDDPIIATDIKSLLKHEGFGVVGVAKNALRALDLLHSAKPNFAILDVHLGKGQSGIDIAEIIHDKYHIPYIFLTSFSDNETLAAAQEQSPYGYLVKPFQDRTLITTIATAWLNYKKTLKSDEPDFTAHNVALTEQEQVICTHLYRGESYKQICAARYISMNTLKYHVKNIYSKFKVAGRAELTALLNTNR